MRMKISTILKAAGCWSLLILLAVALAGISGCASKQTASLPAITPTPTGQHQVGKFVWFDLLTEDVQAAQGFYKELFGWRFEDKSSNYSVIYSGDKPIGGIAPHENKDPEKLGFHTFVYTHLKKPSWIVAGYYRISRR